MKLPVEGLSDSYPDRYRNNAHDVAHDDDGADALGVVAVTPALQNKRSRRGGSGLQGEEQDERGIGAEPGDEGHNRQNRCGDEEELLQDYRAPDFQVAAEIQIEAAKRGAQREGRHGDGGFAKKGRGFNDYAGDVIPEPGHDEG